MKTAAALVAFAHRKKLRVFAFTLQKEKCCFLAAAAKSFTFSGKIPFIRFLLSICAAQKSSSSDTFHFVQAFCLLADFI